MGQGATAEHLQAEPARGTSGRKARDRAWQGLIRGTRAHSTPQLTPLLPPKRYFSETQLNVPDPSARQLAEPARRAALATEAVVPTMEET